MTAVGDQVIKLLELGDTFTWVTRKDRSDALALLKNDRQFDATIRQLGMRKFLREFLQRYFMDQGTPTLYDAVMVFAARANGSSAAMIEKALSGMRYVDRDAVLLQLRFGNSTQTFGLAHDLAVSMRANRVLTMSAGSPSTTATIPTSPTKSFSGSGATGRDVFGRTVPTVDQARVYYEQKTNPKPNPADSGPVSKRYSNPLVNLTVPSSNAERLAQAVRVTSLPISTIFAPIYLNGPPSRAAVMNAAAKLYSLTPEVIGAIILAEQRDQSRNEDMMDYTAATHSISRRTTSIGLGQVRDDTAKRTDLFSALLTKKRRQNLTQTQIATLLACDEFNIFAVAKYIRYVAKLGSSQTATNLPDTVRDFPGVDFAAYAKHASQWPAANVAALGAEYTSTPWDDITTFWGDFVGFAHDDMSGASITW